MTRKTTKKTKTTKPTRRPPKAPAKTKELLALRKVVEQDRKALITELASVAAAVNEAGDAAQVFGPADDLIDAVGFADFCDDLLLAPQTDCCKTPAAAQAPKAKLTAEFVNRGREVDIRLTATHPCGVYGYYIDATISRFRPATAGRPSGFDRVKRLKTFRLTGLSGDLDESLGISVAGLLPPRRRSVLLVQFAAVVVSRCSNSPFTRVSKGVFSLA